MAKRVFFSFHYQDVIDFRVNVVRNHNTTKKDSAGYFDASIWETAKKTGDLALKRLINGELQNTSITAVLIGSETYDRRWVRYEIMKSLSKGNKIIGIHINNFSDKHGRIKSLGENPLDYLAYQFSSDGTQLNLFEWKKGKWISYSDLDSYKINKVGEELRGKSYRLSDKFKTYDWVKDDGYNKFPSWLE